MFEVIDDEHADFSKMAELFKEDYANLGIELEELD
jgi:hypothetical protein